LVLYQFTHGPKSINIPFLNRQKVYCIQSMWQLSFFNYHPLVSFNIISFDRFCRSSVRINSTDYKNKLADWTDSKSLPANVQITFILNLFGFNVNFDSWISRFLKGSILGFGSCVITTNDVNITAVYLYNLWPHWPSLLTAIFKLQLQLVSRSF
jgi:hypothetical protein